MTVPGNDCPECGRTLRPDGTCRCGAPALPEGWTCFVCSALNRLFTYRCRDCGALRS